MFVIRRRVGERIVIAGNIELEVLEISKTRIKLGICAPAAVTVTRGEALPVAAENRAASAWVSTHMDHQPAQLAALLENLRRESVQAPVCEADQ
jgi:carbon storage regulator